MLSTWTVAAAQSTGRLNFQTSCTTLQRYPKSTIPSDSFVSSVVRCKLEQLIRGIRSNLFNFLSDTHSVSCFLIFLVSKSCQGRVPRWRLTGNSRVVIRFRPGTVRDILVKIMLGSLRRSFWAACWLAFYNDILPLILRSCKQEEIASRTVRNKDIAPSRFSRESLVVESTSKSCRSFAALSLS